MNVKSKSGRSDVYKGGAVQVLSQDRKWCAVFLGEGILKEEKRRGCPRNTPGETEAVAIFKTR